MTADRTDAVSMLHRHRGRCPDVGAAVLILSCLMSHLLLPSRQQQPHVASAVS